MIGDTISITINSIAKVLSKINQDAYTSEYFLKETLSQYQLKIKHTKDKVSAGSLERHRHVLTLTQTVFPVAPATLNTVRQYSITLVGDYNDDNTVQGQNGVGVNTWASQANLVKLLNWES